MDILKIGILGIVAVLLALMLKKYHVEYSSYISIAGLHLHFYVCSSKIRISDRLCKKDADTSSCE